MTFYPNVKLNQNNPSFYPSQRLKDRTLTLPTDFRQTRITQEPLKESGAIPTTEARAPPTDANTSLNMLAPQIEFIPPPPLVLIQPKSS